MSEVRDWLDNLELGDFAEVFESEKIGPKAVPHLTEADLKEMGVTDRPAQSDTCGDLRHVA